MKKLIILALALFSAPALLASSAHAEWHRHYAPHHHVVVIHRR